MRMLSSVQILFTVVRRHGSAERAAHLFLTLHSGLNKAVQCITDTDTASLVTVHEVHGAAVVNVDDTVLPVPIERALEGFIAEMISQKFRRGCNKSQCKNFSDSDLLTQQAKTQHTQNRRLLFFQELVMAIEMRVREG
jgi:hypothetical protein